MNGDIRYLHISEGHSIGEKRNFGCKHARGGIIAHWDDDDYSDSNRLADQVRRLQDSGKAVTGYHSMLFTDGACLWLHEGRRGRAVGTSLCYRREFWQAHPFPAKQIAEDNDFSDEAEQTKQIITADGGCMNVASIHKDNTSPRNLKADSYKLVENPSNQLREISRVMFEFSG